MARKRSRMLTQGPFGPPEGSPQRGEAGPPPEWWPKWMPWVDVDAWKQMFKGFTDFATEGREAVSGREALTNVSDYLEDWYKKARKAVDERMK